MVNTGLTKYIEIYQKPENGFEILITACGWSGKMYTLKIEKTAEQEGTHIVAGSDELTHEKRPQGAGEVSVEHRKDFRSRFVLLSNGIM